MSIYLCKLQKPLWCSLSAQELLFKPPFIAFVCFICCTFHLPKDDLCYQGHRVNTREDIYMSIYRSSLIVRMTVWATASCMLTPPTPPPAPPPPPPPSQAWAQEFDEDRQLSLQPQSRHNSHGKLWRIATCLLAVVKYIVE